MKKCLSILSLFFLLSNYISRAQISFNLETWLNDHQAIRNQINWETGLNVFVSYNNWSVKMKNDLDIMVRKVIVQENLDIQDPIELFIKPAVGKLVSPTLYPDDAWQIYLAHIAQTIVVDVYNYVSWKLDDASEQKIKHLFNSSSFYKFAGDHYEVLYEHGSATLGDPLFVFNFLRNNNLIGFNEKNTIERILNWARDNLSHYGRYCSPVCETMEQSYLRCFDGFSGYYPPIKVIINGVHNSLTNSQYHWTMGCHGTTGFLKGVCRVINIEVKDNFDYESPNIGHSLPIFPGINSFMSHADDLYASSSKTTPRIEISKLLFDLSDFDDFYNDENQAKYVGFACIKYFLDYMPYDLLQLYCSNNSDVHYISNYYGLDKFYTGTDLDSINSLLQLKIDSLLGKVKGCNSKDYWDFLAKYRDKPYHKLNSGADIISVSLNMPIEEKIIDNINQIINIKLKQHEIPDTLIATLICSDWASVKKMNETNISLDQPTIFEVKSEDLITVKNWQLIITDDALTDIEITENNKSIKIYPNPISNELIIDIKGNYEKGNFEILNLIGQVVFKGKLAGNTVIQTSSFAPGVYLIKLENGKSFEFKKIVKE